MKYLTRPGGGVLHCGCGRGGTVNALLGDAFDAWGVDVAELVSSGDSQRLMHARAEALPFEDARFSTVLVSAAWLEHLDADALDLAIAELARVSRGAIVVETSGSPLRTEGASACERGREWWESRFIARHFRRHPCSLASVDYESLETETAGALLVFDKLPCTSAVAHPLASLRTERDLHMDMLRETGRRADAHLARYEWARGWIKPGDTVVDAACGLGYGAALLWDGSEAARVVGIDISSTAVAYARDNYVPDRPGLEFRVGDAEAWDGWSDASVDCIVSFETLEHLPNPARFLAGARRVLKPGGRFLCSVPNMWVDETGRDPNPHHLHVFDLERLIDAVSPVLLVDEVYAQSAGGHAGRFAPRRLLRSIGWPGRDAGLVAGAEWWLLSGVKDPLEDAGVPYVEQVFPAAADAAPNAVAFARDYVHPWAVHALVMGTFRVRSLHLLVELATRWLAVSPADSADAGAALCLLAYRGLESDSAFDVGSLLESIEAYCAREPLNPQVLRWQVSLQFVRGRLHLRRGELRDAEACFRRCAGQNATAFTPHLETKTTEAAWLAGRLARERGDAITAAADWSGASEALERLKSAPVSEWLLSPERPAPFERGDGLREIAVAVDNAALSANALRQLRDPSGAWRPGPGAVDRNFQRNTERLLETVRSRGGEIQALRAGIDRAHAELQSVHQQWQATRETLHDVTCRLRDADAIGRRRKTENAVLRAVVERIVRQSSRTGTASAGAETDTRAGALMNFSTRRLVQHRPSMSADDRPPVRVGIFGTGEGAMKVWEALAEIETTDVVWFADNDPRQQGERRLWIDVIAPAAIPSHACDAIVIGSMSRDAIRDQLLAIGIAADRIITPDVQQSVDDIRGALRHALAA